MKTKFSLHPQPIVFAFLIVCLSLITACQTATPTAPAATATASGPKQWSSPPEMRINTSKTYIATLHTTRGDIVIELLPKVAPITVNNFVFLAREGFYNGVTFHRVLPDFMAQGGDPTGTGSGGPGYQFQDEFGDLTFDTPGILAMANAGPGTNGSQFFITYVPTPWLDGHHTIFGKVVSGMEVAYSLTPRDPQQNPTTPGDAINSITIEEK
jgi:cyclophilin family peptidyl-prolyl cis-trans isomerase